MRTASIGHTQPELTPAQNGAQRDMATLKRTICLLGVTLCILCAPLIGVGELHVTVTHRVGISWQGIAAGLWQVAPASHVHNANEKLPSVGASFACVNFVCVNLSRQNLFDYPASAIKALPHFDSFRSCAQHCVVSSMPSHTVGAKPTIPRGPGLVRVGERHWEPLLAPHDLPDWIGFMQNQLSRHARIQSSTAPWLTVKAATIGNASASGCRYGCTNRGRCDQLLGKCVCRHGFSGDSCEILTKQLCNDPRKVCVGRDCHEFTRLVSRCSGSCDYTSNRCTCGPRSANPNRHMFMCEMLGIGRLTTWRSPGWAGFTKALPHEMWSSPNSTPPWFEEAAGGRANLDAMWRQSYAERPDHRRAFENGERLGWCDIPLAPAAAVNDVMSRRHKLRFPRCGCYENGGGLHCDEPIRSFCLNQCSHHGECIRGYCVCSQGWSGADCSIPLAALDHRTSKVAVLPNGVAAQRRAANGGRPHALRPSIFVYELPVKFNTWLAETRLHPQDCTYRRYLGGNQTYWENYAFGLEMALHEILLASPHRTLDPESADFFFVPTYGGCYISRFFRPTPLHNIIMVGHGEWKAAPVRGNEFYREALHWVRTTYPYWNRSGGSDHLLAFPHDEGACVAPIELQNATLLTSWGRLEKRPRNATTTMVEHSWYVPAFVKDMYASLHCYDPRKDILMPVFTSVKQLFKSPHLHGAPRQRRLLFSWRGQVLYHFPKYSFGIRQQLVALFHGREAEGIVVSDKHSSRYLDEMLDSKFCGVFPGNGWGHIEAPILLGCIPVVIQDAILTPWENVLNFSAYAVRIPRARMHELPEILRKIPDARVRQMQDALARVWERFTYSSVALAERSRRCAEGPQSANACREITRSLKGRAAEATGRDAVDTLMQVLNARLIAKSASR